MVKVHELEEWLQQSKPGEERIYYLGHLAVDRYRPVVTNGKLEFAEPIEPINSIAQLMHDASERGEVELYQRRVDDFEYQYVARKL